MKAYYSPTQLDDLGKVIGALAITKLQRTNTLSDRQAEMTEKIGRILAHLAGGSIHDGRHMIAGPYGLGKTTALKAAVAVLGHETPDLGFLTLQQTIAAGRETIGEALEYMAERGWKTPPRFVLHVHSGPDGARPYQSRPYRFPFATHERTKRDSIHVVAHDEMGELRPAVVDEAMRAAWACGVTLADLAKSLEFLKLELGPRVIDARAQQTLAWCSDFHKAALVRAEISHVRAYDAGSDEIGREAEDIDLPTVTDTATFDLMMKVLNARTIRAAAEPFRRVLEASNRDSKYRLVRTSDFRDGEAPASAMVLQHRRTLADVLKHVVAFDAGAEVDELLALDDGIKLATESLPEYMPAWAVAERSLSTLKDYTAVQVLHMNEPGGKVVMEEHPDHAVMAEVARLAAVRLERDGRQVLIIVHVGSRCAEMIRRELKLRGVADAEIAYDLVADEPIPTPKEMARYRVAFTHWGMHDSLNLWQTAGTVIAVGGSTLRTEDAAAIALGQATRPGASPAATPSRATTTAVKDAQVALNNGQAAGRGAARRLDNGKADPMLFAWIYADEAPGDGSAMYGPVTARLVKLLPGAKWYRWRVPGREKVETLTRMVADAIEGVLRSWIAAGNTYETPVRQVRRALPLELRGLAVVSSDVLSEALNAVLADPKRARGWYKPRGRRVLLWHRLGDVVDVWGDPDFVDWE